MYYVGQKVWCVNDKWKPKYDDIVHPVCGRIYTIRDIVKTTNGSGIGCRLEEVVNNPKLYQDAEGLMEHTFEILAFRPLMDSEIASEIKKEELIPA